MNAENKTSELAGAPAVVQQRVVSLPRFEGHYPKKWVECEKCGHVSLHPKAYPLKLSSCKTCGSTRIRIYKEKRQANDGTQRGRDAESTDATETRTRPSLK